MALDDDIRDLGRNATLGVLEAEALRLIAFAAESRRYRSGDVLFVAGELADGGYLLRSGSVSLEASGIEDVVTPPALIGDAALLAETIRPATAYVREPSEIMKIPRSLFLRALNEYPDSAVRLRSGLAERMRRFARDLEAVRRDVLDR